MKTYNKFHTFFNVSFSSLFLFSLYKLIFPEIDSLTPDSQGFLDKSIQKTPGYPFFLWLIQLFDQDFIFLPIYQGLLVIISGAICFQTCDNFVPKKWVWSITGVIAVGNPIMWKYTNLILSESLYISCSMLFFSFLVLGLKKNSSKYLITSSIILGITILIRPVGYAFLASSILISLFIFRSNLKKSYNLLAPVLAILLTICSYNFLKKGFFATQVFGGHNIVGQTSHLIKTENNLNLPTVHKIEEKLSSRNKLIKDLSNFQFNDFFWITTSTYNFSVWEIIIPNLSNYIEENFEYLNKIEQIRKINDISWQISINAIQNSPFEYMRCVSIHFLSMWLIPHISNKKKVQKIEVKLKSINSKFELPRIVKNNIPSFLINIKNFLMLGLFIFSLFSLFYFFFNQKSFTFLLAAVSSILINSNNFLVALVEPAIPRYIMAIFPFICILVSILVILALNKIKEKE